MTRLGEVQVDRIDRWLPATGSGLQARYGRGPLGGLFYFRRGRRKIAVSHASGHASLTPVKRRSRQPASSS